jgi:hypothetical protein
MVVTMTTMATMTMVVLLARVRGAVFRFLSEDWSPWIALLRMRERWPEMSFRLIPSYLQMV